MWGLVKGPVHHQHLESEGLAKTAGRSEGSGGSSGGATGGCGWRFTVGHGGLEPYSNASPHGNEA